MDNESVLWYSRKTISEELKLKTLKTLFLIVMFVMLTADWFLAGEGTRNSAATQSRARNQTNESDQRSVQLISCNWSGWKNSFPEVKCSYNRCERKREVLSMKCLDGFVTEVKTAKVCAGCEIF
jgi:hypothetical protein